MPEALTWACAACGDPHRHFPTGAKVVRPAPVALGMIVSCTSETTVGEIKNISFITANPGEYMACQRATSQSHR